MKKVGVLIHYAFRLFLVYMFVWHGIEKLVKKIDPQEYIDYGLGGDFLDFYLLWERTGFIYVIGFFQLIGGLLLLFKRTTLFGAILLLPLSIGMLSTHVFISHNLDFFLLDFVILLMNLSLIIERFPVISSPLFQERGSII